MNTKSAQDLTKKVSDQIRVSLVQAILSVVGSGYLGKFIDGSITIDRLEPDGQKFTIRCSVEIYPDNREKKEETSPA